MSGLRYPSHGRSGQSGHPARPSAEGRSCWLNLLRKILSFSIPNRFYPGTLRPLFVPSVAGLRCPSHGRLRLLRYRNRPSAEGRSDWLNFLRKILSFSIPNRFYPGTLCPRLSVPVCRIPANSFSPAGQCMRAA